MQATRAENVALKDQLKKAVEKIAELTPKEEVGSSREPTNERWLA